MAREAIAAPAGRIATQPRGLLVARGHFGICHPACPANAPQPKEPIPGCGTTCSSQRTRTRAADDERVGRADLAVLHQRRGRIDPFNDEVHRMPQKAEIRPWRAETQLGEGVTPDDFAEWLIGVP